ncbi:MAG: hypothetical protein F6J87_09930 [Spirulina sp. SIO3F2]|nr:hypothetical protein [Spirulina sp. SIO3F2]
MTTTIHYLNKQRSHLFFRYSITFNNINLKITDILILWAMPTLRDVFLIKSVR